MIEYMMLNAVFSKHANKSYKLVQKHNNYKKK